MNPSLTRWLNPGTVDIDCPPGGLTRLQIQGQFGSARFYLQGAHLAHFQPRAQDEMFFVSTQSHFTPGKAIRGGIPVIFPWFGPREGHPDSPMHGLVRTREWELTEVHVPAAGAARVTFRIESSPETSAVWPHAFALELRFTLGDTLHIAWSTHNTGTDAFTFEQALHPYFPIADVHRARVHGLHGARFLDKTAGPELQTDSAEAVQFTRETDRLYLDTETPLVLEDPAANRRLVITKQGSQSSVVWNPWIAKAEALADLGDAEWQAFVCVEQVNAKHNAIRLEPGTQHRMEAEFRVEHHA